MSFEVKVSRPQKPNGFLAPYPPPQPACPAGGSDRAALAAERLAAALMSTVPIVPFLMFLEVTMTIAAVPLAAATTAATTSSDECILTRATASEE
jgi:hypothetical protein